VNWIGIIDENAWNNIENGYITIRFYANYTLGYLAYKDVIVIKDAPDPEGIYTIYNTARNGKWKEFGISSWNDLLDEASSQKILVKLSVSDTSPSHIILQS